ncbi:MAG: ThiF family adenylyltransferase [Anaerolineae bacterium]|nr:ThiF family adenylyltransferase [Anaerolineae bacterium]
MTQEMASSRGGQHLAWMLVNLLCRQFKIIQELVLDVPTTPLQPGVAPFGAMASLIETLEQCVRLVSGPYVQVRQSCENLNVDVILLIGTDAAPDQRHWRLYADGWRYYVGNSGTIPDTAPASNLSIGPYLCASYAAGEVFKLLRGLRPRKGEFIEHHYASAWTMSCGDSWQELSDGPGRDGFEVLPHFYFAGAGAVAQAAALCLGSSEFSGSSTVVDGDTLDLTNGNRYVLSHREHDKAQKVALMQAYLASNGFDCKPVSMWWEEFNTSCGRHAISDSVRRLECDYKFPVVLSCVDKNEPRHALQQSLPQLIIGGSTDGLTAKASIFDLGRGTACLKCHNPIQKRNDIARVRIGELKLLNEEQLARFCREHDITTEEVARFLAPGGCGKLSESDIERFAANSPEMSVGFVSTAAGVLLAAQFLRVVALEPAVVASEGAMSVATFARAKLRLMHVGVDVKCDCSGQLRQRWDSLWQRSWTSRGQ